MSRTAEEFMARFRGYPAPLVALALAKFTPGVNWRRAPKRRMAKAWADPRSLCLEPIAVTLDALEAEVRRIRAVEEGWT